MALCLVEWSQRKDHPWDRRASFIYSISSLKSIIPFAGACAGILTYFAYNGAVFGSLVPVSGAVKLKWAQAHWAESEYEYSFVQNFQDMIMMHRLSVGPSELVAALEVCAYIFVVGWFGYQSRRREDYLLLSFLIGVFSLGCGHLAQCTYIVLFWHPDMASYSQWYYVPAYLMMTLIVPVRCYVIVHLIHRWILPESHRVANVANVSILVIGTIFIFEKTNFTGPYLFVDQRSKHLAIEDGWMTASYTGVSVMNRILPEGSRVGSRDAGIIGYFSRFPVVELGGLVNTQKYKDSLDGYFSSLNVVDSFGITHFANDFRVGDSFSPSGKALFEGFPFWLGNLGYEFKIRFAMPPWASSSEIDPTAWFWRRMEPYFDYRSQFGDVGVVIDSRLALSFAKECAPDDRRMIVLQWTDEEGRAGGAIQHPWRNEGETPWVCGDVSLLPKNPTLPVRISLTTENGLGSFKDGFDNWRLDGDAVPIYGQMERTVEQPPISGNVGQRFLTSYHPNRGDAATGTARSPEFTIADGQLLTFLIAGGDKDGVGVRLLADGFEVNVWRGKNTGHFERAFYVLDGLAGKTLQLELFDSEVGGWGHISSTTLDCYHWYNWNSATRGMNERPD